MMKVLPYKLGSKSARLLAQALGVKRIRPQGHYRPRSSVMVLNWGNSKGFNHPRMLNKPSAIALATNKLSAFRAMEEESIATVPFTSDPSVAKDWQEDGYRVVCRTLLTGHSGKGIIIAQPDEELPRAPLYTKYTKKDKEFRVHVFNGKIIDVCEKRKRSGQEITNSLVRTLNNGWVYCRQNVTLAETGKDLAMKAVRSLGLDFGAVDIIQRKDKFFVLEINSAPGLEGSTLQKYLNELRVYV